MIAKGFKVGDTMQVAVKFDKDLFEWINEEARRNGTSFSVEANKLCQTGRQCVWESDQHEPAMRMQ